MIESSAQGSFLLSQAKETRLFTALRTYLTKNYPNMEAFVEALQGLVHPEQRMLGWLNQIFELFQCDKSADSLKRQTQLLTQMNQELFL